jgi:hypothetical protein
LAVSRAFQACIWKTSQKAVQIVSAIQEIEPPHGLPRRFAPRNDEGLGHCNVLHTCHCEGRRPGGGCHARFDAVLHTRHCEGRRPVAIHRPHGLPRRCAPRNDG